MDKALLNNLLFMGTEAGVAISKGLYELHHQPEKAPDHFRKAHAYLEVILEKLRKQYT